MAASMGRVCVLCDKMQRCSLSGLVMGRAGGATSQLVNLWHQQTRTATNKHWDPKWRKQRAAKVLRFTLPDYQKFRKEANMSPGEIRDEMKRRGQMPPRSFSERNMLISSTNSIFEAYVPPEGDGIASVISKEGAKQRMTELEKKGKSLLQVRQIKKFEEDFDTKTFAQKALDIYIEAHNLLENVSDNEDRLHELVSEKAYPEMVWLLEKKTVRWNYIEALEAPRVVHVRVTDMLSKDNKYGQVTVRLHTKQTLALYDRFGRLAYGSEHLAKNVVEYVVFEKHLSDEYGEWRIHGKIVPDWMPPRDPVLRTLRKPEFKPVKDIPDAKSEESGTPPPSEGGNGQQPALATA